MHYWHLVSYSKSYFLRKGKSLPLQGHHHVQYDIIFFILWQKWLPLVSAHHHALTIQFFNGRKELTQCLLKKFMQNLSKNVTDHLPSNTELDFHFRISIKSAREKYCTSISMCSFLSPGEPEKVAPPPPCTCIHSQQKNLKYCLSHLYWPWFVGILSEPSHDTLKNNFLYFGFKKSCGSQNATECTKCMKVSL